MAAVKASAVNLPTGACGDILIQIAKEPAAEPVATIGYPTGCRTALFRRGGEDGDDVGNGLTDSGTDTGGWSLIPDRIDIDRDQGDSAIAATSGHRPQALLRQSGGFRAGPAGDGTQGEAAVWQRLIHPYVLRVFQEQFGR